MLQTSLLRPKEMCYMLTTGVWRLRYPNLVDERLFCPKQTMMKVAGKSNTKHDTPQPLDNLNSN